MLSELKISAVLIILVIIVLFVGCRLFVGCNNNNLSSLTDFDNQEACVKVTKKAAEVTWDYYKKHSKPITPAILREKIQLPQKVDIIMVKSTSTGPWGRNTLLLYADELGVAFAKMYYGEDKDCSVIITENFKQSVRVNTQYARYNLDLFAQEVANGADPMSMANFYAKTIGQLGPNDADRDFLTEISQQHILECYSQPEKAVIHARTIGLLIDALWHEDKLGHKK